MSQSRRLGAALQTSVLVYEPTFGAAFRRERPGGAKGRRTYPILSSALAASSQTVRYTRRYRHHRQHRHEWRRPGARQRVRYPAAQGSLVFTAASSHLVEVSSASSDRTDVTCTATLPGILDFERMRQPRIKHVAPGRIGKLALLKVKPRMRKSVEIAGVVVVQMRENHVLDVGSVDIERGKRLYRAAQVISPALLRDLGIEPGVDDEDAAASPRQPHEIVHRHWSKRALDHGPFRFCVTSRSGMLCRLARPRTAGSVLPNACAISSGRRPAAAIASSC